MCIANLGGFIKKFINFISGCIYPHLLILPFTHTSIPTPTYSFHSHTLLFHLLGVATLLPTYSSYPYAPTRPLSFCPLPHAHTIPLHISHPNHCYYILSVIATLLPTYSSHSPSYPLLSTTPTSSLFSPPSQSYTLLTLPTGIHTLGRSYATPYPLYLLSTPLN